jgi:hypothetical protein
LQASVFVVLACNLHAQFNSWINPASGNWDNAANWSAGLPNPTQFEVFITNSGSKAVAIQPSTPINFPSSMTVMNLRLAGVAPETNVLLLNFFGTARPLRVINNFNVATNARVLSLNSSLEANNAFNMNGVFNQDGGLLRFTNATMHVDGQFNLTNGLVNGFNMHVGGTANGKVNQYGGLVALTNLVLAYNANSNSQSNGAYSLQNGWLIVGGYEGVGGWGQATLNQSGGTNSTSQLNISLGNYTKTGGGLFVGDMKVFAGVAAWGVAFNGNFSQSAGDTTITNALEIYGLQWESYLQRATMSISGGSLNVLNFYIQPVSTVTHSAGTVRANSLWMSDYGTTAPSSYNFFGGNLFTSNTIIYSHSSFSSFYQTAGAHIVTNLLSIGDWAQYNLVGGTLSAPNIYVSGSPTIMAQLTVSGSALPFAITNTGTIAFSHASLVIPVSQQFGSLFVYSPSQLDFGHASATIRFRDSRTNDWAQDWYYPHRLRILNWSGSTNGGGTDRLVFGTNSSALTPMQLSMIHFVNNDGSESRARILPTGEVVPAPPIPMTSQRVGTNLVLTWPDFAILQYATNIAGPFIDIFTATSPYTNSLKAYPQQFFRLRD